MELDVWQCDPIGTGDPVTKKHGCGFTAFFSLDRQANHAKNFQTKCPQCDSRKHWRSIGTTVVDVVSEQKEVAS